MRLPARLSSNKLLEIDHTYRHRTAAELQFFAHVRQPGSRYMLQSVSIMFFKYFPALPSVILMTVL